MHSANESIGGRDSEAALQRIGASPSEAIELFDYVDRLLLWVKDSEGRYQWVNREFVLNFGFRSREELLGHTDFDICSTALANQYRLDDERVLSGERILGRIELVGRFDHTARWCTTSKLPLRDHEGRVVGTAGVTNPLPDRPFYAGSPLSRVIRYISEHYAESITHRDLAKVSGLSVRALERHFKAAYHSTLHDYIRRLRVRMSCHALVFSQKTLAEVAAEFGFADQSHFSKEFRRVQGETPHAYRARFMR
jgi:PAS domain S-box-containing protein